MGAAKRLADFYTDGGDVGGLFVFASGKHVDLIALIDDDIQDHRLATDLAIFGIGLFGIRTVD